MSSSSSNNIKRSASSEKIGDRAKVQWTDDLHPNELQRLSSSSPSFWSAKKHDTVSAPRQYYSSPRISPTYSPSHSPMPQFNKEDREGIAYPRLEEIYNKILFTIQKLNCFDNSLLFEMIIRDLTQLSEKIKNSMLELKPPSSGSFSPRTFLSSVTKKDEGIISSSEKVDQKKLALNYLNNILQTQESVAQSCIRNSADPLVRTLARVTFPTWIDEVKNMMKQIEPTEAVRHTLLRRNVSPF